MLLQLHVSAAYCSVLVEQSLQFVSHLITVVSWISVGVLSRADITIVPQTHGSFAFSNPMQINPVDDFVSNALPDTCFSALLIRLVAAGRKRYPKAVWSFSIMH